MIAFLNDTSMEEHTDWGAALNLFREVTQELSGIADLFRDSSFFQSVEFKRRFGDSLSGTSPEVRAVIRQIAFSERYWKCWRPSRISVEVDEYSCQPLNLTFTDVSVCEAAEKKLVCSDYEVGMISAVDSNFANSIELEVEKLGSGQSGKLCNCYSIQIVRQWIAQQRGHYDPTSNSAPRDFQTILEKDPARFERTGRHQRVANKERRIYRELKTGRQFYVDEGHPGHSAHLEVFDADGNHLGEADITSGALDPSKLVKGRKITL